jgi:hypothetical protein
LIITIIIKLIIKVKNSELIVKEYSKSSALHELYSYFLDSVKTDVIIGNGQLLLDGNISYSCKERLMHNLKNLLNNEEIQLKTLIGTKEEIIKYIDN